MSKVASFGGGVLFIHFILFLFYRHPLVYFSSGYPPFRLTPSPPCTLSLNLCKMEHGGYLFFLFLKAQIFSIRYPFHVPQYSRGGGKMDMICVDFLETSFLNYFVAGFYSANDDKCVHTHQVSTSSFVEEKAEVPTQFAIGPKIP